MLSNDLLTVYKVAREFESSSLRQRSFSLQRFGLKRLPPNLAYNRGSVIVA
jgi:hypothetical protein